MKPETKELIEREFFDMRMGLDVANKRDLRNQMIGFLKALESLDLITVKEYDLSIHELRRWYTSGY